MASDNAVASEDRCEVALARTWISKLVLTVVAVVDVHAMSIVQPSESLRYVEVRVVVGIVALLADASKVRQQVFMHACSEGFRGANLVVDRSVEGDSLVDDIKGLR